MENKYSNIIQRTNNEVTRKALSSIFFLHEFLETQVRLTNPNLTAQEQLQDVLKRTTVFEQRVIEYGEVVDLEYLAPNPQQGELDTAIFTIIISNNNVMLCNDIEFTIKGYLYPYCGFCIQDVIGTLNETKEK